MRLIAAKCPSCGANVRIDLEREIATCDYCKASSFVQTNKRRATEEIRQQHPLVIDAGAAPKPAVSAALGIGLGAVVIAGVGLFVLQAGARVASPPPLTKQAEVLPEPKPPAPSAASQPTRKLSPAELAKLQKSATVRAGAIRVVGRLDAAAIQRRVRTLTDRFLHCYTESLSRTPTLSGRINLKFVVATNGTISSIEPSPAPFTDEPLERCVTAVLTPLTFPRPAGSATVQYPLIFSTD